MARALLPQNVCHTLWCSVGTTCHSKLDAAVDGTTCGESKVGLRPGSLLRLCEASAWLGDGACPQGPPVPSGPRPRRRAQMRGRAGGCSRRPLGDQHVGSLSSSAAPPGPSRAPRPPCALRGGRSSALFAVVSGRGVCGRGPPARGGGRGLVGLERLVRLLAELRRGRAERRAAVHAAHVSLGRGTPAGWPRRCPAVSRSPGPGSAPASRSPKGPHRGQARRVQRRLGSPAGGSQRQTESPLLTRLQSGGHRGLETGGTQQRPHEAGGRQERAAAKRLEPGPWGGQAPRLPSPPEQGPAAPLLWASVSREPV